MFVLIWSLITDDNEYVVGPFPTREDSELWAKTYLADDQKATWNVKRVTIPAQYPAVTNRKHSVDYDLRAMERDLLEWQETFDFTAYDRN